MAKMISLTTAMLTLTAAAGGVLANVAQGDACSTNLSPDGKAIYAAVVAANPTMTNLRDTVEEQTRSLAFNGQISRDTARANAVAAAECIRIRLNN